jgi:hypothetical protein
VQLPETGRKLFASVIPESYDLGTPADGEPAL